MEEPASIDREHARLGPSGWKQWSTCPGSKQLEDQLVEQGLMPDTSSEHSAEGTAMHWVREQCLLTGRDAHEYIGHKVASDGYTFEVNQEWVHWLQPGIDRIREEGGELFVEQRLSLETWAEGEFGTVDCLIIPDDDDGVVVVDDFKGGRGVIVPAKRNGQLMQYALSAWDNIVRHRSKATRFKLRIDQPRAPEKGDEWECTLEDLLRFAEDEYVPAVEATKDPDAPLQASPDGCQFCPVQKAGLCGELNRYVLNLLGLTLEDLNSGGLAMPELEALTPEQRSRIVEHKPMISKWINNVHGAHLSAALAGGDTPGFKAVATEGNREWADPEKAEQFFEGRVPKKDMYSQKLKTPPQMELVAGTRIWARAQKLIHRPPGPPALVPVSDKRPALIPVLDMLDDLPELEDEQLDYDDII